MVGKDEDDTVTRAFRLVALLTALLPHAATAQMQLVMIEQPGCLYCAQWDAEIAPQYPLTTEGKAAPLRRIQLRDALPEDLVSLRPAAFTPTFVLVVDGQDKGRIEGYPGADFFWPLLADLIAGATP